MPDGSAHVVEVGAVKPSASVSPGPSPGRNDVKAQRILDRAKEAAEHHKDSYIGYGTAGALYAGFIIILTSLSGAGGIAAISQATSGSHQVHLGVAIAVTVLSFLATLLKLLQAATKPSVTAELHRLAWLRYTCLVELIQQEGHPLQDVSSGDLQLWSEKFDRYNNQSPPMVDGFATMCKSARSCSTCCAAMFCIDIYSPK